MEQVPVESSSLASVGYDPANMILEIEFHRGGTYQYFNIPVQIHQGLMDASSKGTYLDQNIKKTGYPYKKIG